MSFIGPPIAAIPAAPASPGKRHSAGKAGTSMISAVPNPVIMLPQNIRSCGRAGIGCGFHRRHVAADDGRDQPRVDFLIADEHDIGGFDHRVGRLDHADEAPRFDETERFAGELSCHRHDSTM